MRKIKLFQIVVGVLLLLVIAYNYVPSRWYGQETLLDELEGKVKLSPAERDIYKNKKWHKLEGYKTPPFFGLKPALMEYLPGKDTNGGIGGIRLLDQKHQRSVYEERSGLVTNLLDKADIKPNNPTKFTSRFEFDDKRFFLASIEPTIVIVVAFKNKQERDESYNLDHLDGKFVMKFGFPLEDDCQPPRWINNEYEKGNCPLMGQPTHVVLTSVFSKSLDIKVLSDKWEGIRTLEQMELDPKVPFKVIPVPGETRYLQLVLK
jgi:hypothetical protein